MRNITIDIVLFMMINYQLFNTEKINDDYLVEDINGKIQNLSSIVQEKIGIFIFFSYYNCYDCMIAAKESIATFKYNKLYKGVIIRSNNDIINKKECINRVKNIFYNFNLFFDLHNKEDSWPPCNLREGLFSKFKICITPAILIINGNQINFINYQKLSKIKFNKDSIHNEVKKFIE